MKSTRLLSLSLVMGTALVFAGCGEQTEDQTTETTNAAVQSTPAAAVTGTAVALVEAPTPEQIASAKAYPLEKCIISNEELGSMGEPVVVVFNDQVVKFCCKGCIDDFKADPASHVSKLTRAN